MKKTICSALCFAVLLCLVACGDGGDDKRPVIRFWHFWSEPYQRGVIDSLVKIFENENDCRVEITPLSWNDGKTKLFAAFNSNTAPDVLELGSDWVAQFSSAGVLKEIDSASAEMGKYHENFLSPCYWKKKIYSLPWIVDTRVLFINRKLVKDYKAGEELTMEKTMQLCSSIPYSDTTYCWGVNGPDAHRLYKKLVTFFWSNGGNILNENGKPEVNTDMNVKALEFYVSLRNRGMLEAQKEVDNAFLQGRVGFWISGAWMLNKLSDSLRNLKLELAAIPGLNGNKGISFAGGEYLAVNKKSGNAPLAEKLIQFLTDGANAIEFCKRIPEAGFPADKKYFDSPYFRKIPYKSFFAEQLKHSKMTPVHPRWLDMEKALEDAAEKVLYNKATAKEALDEAQAKLIKLAK